MHIAINKTNKISWSFNNTVGHEYGIEGRLFFLIIIEFFDLILLLSTF